MTVDIRLFILVSSALPGAQDRSGIAAESTPELQAEGPSDRLSLSTGELDDGAEHAFMEVEALRATYFVGEPIRVSLRVGLDAEFFQTHAVQMFQQRLDAPVQIWAPWLTSLSGTIARAGPIPSSSRDAEIATCVLNEGIVRTRRLADRMIDGRRFTLLSLERAFVPVRSGTLVIPATELRFAYGTRFEEDFFQGPIAVDRRAARVVGRGLQLEIVALPESGRPLGFSGAVGRFSVRAEASTRDLAVAESLKLVLTIEGEGNLESFDPPRLRDLAGFRVLGMLDGRSEARRTITFDLAPVSEDVTELPPIPFAFFDPTHPAGYRSIATESIPLVVRPPRAGLEGGHGTSVETAGAPAAGSSSRQTDAPRGSARWLWSGMVLIAASAALGLRIWLRARRAGSSGSDSRSLRSVAAASVFRAEIDRPDADVAQAFAGFLAAHLDCPAGAVLAPELAPRLAAAGLGEALAARAAVLLADLLAVHYGGRVITGTTEAARSLADELDAAFQALAKQR